ncbi:MAG: leucine-rich repeat domain-containing protein, partial [Alphaproteobacteria bacterium]|nr:leucine-rich repeat domain-containing protein [Alphaproteobacteria bacterium]
MKKVQSNQTPKKSITKKNTGGLLTHSEKETITTKFITFLEEYYNNVGKSLDSLYSIQYHILNEKKLILTMPTKKEAMLSSGFSVAQTHFLGKIIPILSQFTWIKELKISWENPEGINLILQYMPHINTLDLSRNNLSKVPEGVIKLRRLKDLDLSSNYFTTFPKSILLALKNIKTVNLTDNPLLTKSYEDKGVKHLGRKDLARDPRIIMLNEKTHSVLESFWTNTMPPFSYYLSDFHTFSTMIFSDLPEARIVKDSFPDPVYTLDKIIYNVSGYPNLPKDPFYPKGEKIVYPPDGTIDKEGAHYMEGRPIFLKKNKIELLNTKKKDISFKKGIPIDYTIFLPKGEIKAIWIHVYGGIAPIMTPTPQRKMDKYLLSQGIAVIQLHLADLALFSEEAKHFQMGLPDNVHKKIHESIHAFWNVLKKNPNELLKNPKDFFLNNLIGKDIFLFGSSFGGRTALRHAEFHPNTFTGYISHDGVLSFDMKDKTMRHQEVLSEKNMNLDPMKGIKKLVDPILILQNYDDNLITNHVTIDFIEKAQNFGKNVKFFMPSKGSAINKWGLKYKGHFTPDTQDEFDLYAKTILAFIQSKGHSTIPSITQWRTAEGKLY